MGLGFPSGRGVPRGELFQEPHGPGSGTSVLTKRLRASERCAVKTRAARRAPTGAFPAAWGALKDGRRVRGHRTENRNRNPRLAVYGTAGEDSLGNSAKWTHNFGRRVASGPYRARPPEPAGRDFGLVSRARAGGAGTWVGGFDGRGSPTV